MVTSLGLISLLAGPVLANDFGVKGKGGQEPKPEPTAPPECDQCPWPPPESDQNNGETGRKSGKGSGSQRPTGGDPVDAYTGRMFLQKTDLVVNGVVPIRMTRQYDSRSNYDSPLGYGWSFTYDMRLFEYPDDTVTVRGWEGRRWRYAAPDPQGLYPALDPARGALPKLEEVTQGTVTHKLTFQDGNRVLFDADGKIYAFETPQGNRLRFSYAPQKAALSGMSPYALDPTTARTVAQVWQITSIREQLKYQVGTNPEEFTDRAVALDYDPTTGRLRYIQSHDGRRVDYAHLEAEFHPAATPPSPVFRGNLASVAGPYNPILTPPESAAEGVLETYRYPGTPLAGSSAEAFEHIHNLTYYDDGEGTETHITEYDISSDRVTAQDYGDSHWDFSYVGDPATQTTIDRTIVTPNFPDPGTSSAIATTVYSFSAEGFLIEKQDALDHVFKYPRVSGRDIDRVEVFDAADLVTPIRSFELSHYSSGLLQTRAVTLSRTGETITENWTYTGPFIGTYEVNSSIPNANGAYTEFQYLDPIFSENVSAIRRRESNGGTPSFVTTTFAYDDEHGQLETVTPPAVPGDSMSIRRVYYDENDDDPVGSNPRVIRNGLLKRIEILDGVTVDDHLAREFDYDAAGNAIKITDALDEVTDLAWDSRGRVVRVTTQMGGDPSEWESTLLRYGAPSDDTTPGSFLYEVETGALGPTGGDSEGQIRRFERDARGRVSEVRRKDGGAYALFAEFRYDSDDNRVHSSQPAEPGVNRTVHSGYDRMRQLTSVKDDAGNETQFAYDALGNRKQVTDANDQVVDFVFDELDRLVEVIQRGNVPMGSPLAPLANDLSTKFAYDVSGNVTSVTDPKVNETIYAYDELSRLVKVTQPLGTPTEVTYDYDDRGRLETVTNGRGQTLTYTYFPWGGLDDIEHDLNDGGSTEDRTVSYTYDLNGNLRATVDDDFLTSAAAGSPAGEEPAQRLYTFTYDELDRVEGVTAHYISPSPQLTSSYDPFGNRDTLTLSQGAESLVHGWNYDDLNRLANLTAPGDSTPTVSFTYLGNDDLDTITHGNGLVTDYDYHPEGVIQAVTVGPVATPLHRLAYTIDPALNIDTVTETIAGVQQSPAYGYGYDAVYRLVGASYPTGLGLPGSEAFPYDDAGNRDDDPLAASPWEYDANNRIQKSPSAGTLDVAYGFDNDGNMTSRDDNGATRTLSWDATNRLRQVVDSASGTTTYRHDPFGRRLEKTTGGTTTRYLWDGDQLLAEYDGSGNRQRRYGLAGGFSPVQMVEGAGGQCNDGQDNDGDSLSDTADPDCTSASDPTEGTELEVHADHLDTPRMLTDRSGVAVWRAAQEAFGAAIVDEDPDGDSAKVTFNIRFPGQYYDDETGLHYNRFRYYDAAIGRYVSADPIGQAGGPNVFSYAKNNPLNWLDARGAEPTPPPRDSGGNPSPPPVPPPPDKHGNEQGWRPVPGTEDRPTKWVPENPVPSDSGGQPSGSWDADNGHWDMDDGQGGRRRYLPDGTEVDHDNNPVNSDYSVLDDLLGTSFCAQNPSVCAGVATGLFLGYQAGKACVGAAIGLFAN
ncbi:MAG: RHS repeat-associated core domain-containing protein [Myxococcota bacterium]